MHAILLGVSSIEVQILFQGSSYFLRVGKKETFEQITLDYAEMMGILIMFSAIHF